MGVDYGASYTVSPFFTLLVWGLVWSGRCWAGGWVFRDDRGFGVCFVSSSLIVDMGWCQSGGMERILVGQVVMVLKSAQVEISPPFREVVPRRMG